MSAPRDPRAAAICAVPTPGTNATTLPDHAAANTRAHPSNSKLIFLATPSWCSMTTHTSWLIYTPVPQSALRRAPVIASQDLRFIFQERDDRGDSLVRVALEGAAGFPFSRCGERGRDGPGSGCTDRRRVHPGGGEIQRLNFFALGFHDAWQRRVTRLVEAALYGQDCRKRHVEHLDAPLHLSMHDRARPGRVHL